MAFVYDGTANSLRDRVTDLEGEVFGPNGSAYRLHQKLTGVEPISSATVLSPGGGTARTLAEWMGDVVNVKAEGAVGDGVTDDTDAIIRALEKANGIAEGTWETGGDAAGAYPTRAQRPVFGPAGVYRVTRTIPIRFADVQIHGPPTPGVGTPRFVLLVDHDGDGFAINRAFEGRHFGLLNVGLRKSATHTGTGYGVSIAGASWHRGFQFVGSSASGFVDGIRLDTGNTSIANIVVRDSALGGNTGYGFYSADIVNIGEIATSNITQNGTGGIYTGGGGLTIRDNDLEGQPLPLTLVNTTNFDVTITGNYFEQGTVPAQPQIIRAETVRRLTVARNFFSTGITEPPIRLVVARHASVDRPAVLQGAHAVTSSAGFRVADGESFTGSWNLSEQRFPLVDPSAVGNLYLFGPGGIGPSVAVTHARFAADLPASPAEQVDAYRQIYTVPTPLSQALAATDTLGVSVVIKYPSSLPVTTQLLLPVYLSADGSAWDKLGDFSFYPTDGLRRGDSLLLVAAVKVSAGAATNTGKTYNRVRVYVYPYGTAEAHTGTGALVGRIATYTLPSAEFQPLNPVAAHVATERRSEVFGTAAPTAGTWAVGDTAWNREPAVGQPVGWKCTVAGAPGTWVALANL